MPWHSGRVLEEDETSQCRVPCFRGFRSRFVKLTVNVMTKRMWEGRREGFKVNSTMEESQGPGRPSTRGRFSESWKRLSSRHGSTKRSGLASQQAAVRSRRASVCAPFFPVCWIWSKGVGCRGGTADRREEEQRTRAWDYTEMERGGCRKESGLSRWESKGPLLSQRMSVESFSTCSTLWPLKGFYDDEWCFHMHRTEAWVRRDWQSKREKLLLPRYVAQSGVLENIIVVVWYKVLCCARL